MLLHISAGVGGSDSMDTGVPPTFEPVCSGLKGLFDPIAEAPLPSQWEELASALDLALANGDLYEQL